MIIIYTMVFNTETEELNVLGNCPSSTAMQLVSRAMVEEEVKRREITADKANDNPSNGD